jgi:hypothetical protein
MFSFEWNRAYSYLVVIVCALILTYIGWWINARFIRHVELDEYELIKTYLLNDSPLQGKYKPKLWIHSNVEVNARDWKTNMFRNSSTLAQPYLSLTIQSIINFCGDDFHVCLIDDNSFAKLIPTWDLDMTTVSEPMKTYIREIGMLKLLYFYGGLRVPDSFLCLRSLYPLYKSCAGVGVHALPTVIQQLAGLGDSPIDQGPTSKNESFDEPIRTEVDDTVKAVETKNPSKEKKYNDGIVPFLVENVNRHTGCKSEVFTPTLAMMGALKNSPVIKEWANHLKEKIKSGQVSEDLNITGEVNRMGIDYTRAGRAMRVDGRFVGVKDNRGRPIGVEKLLGTSYLDVTDGDLYGIWIPREDMLRRTKYRWFSIMSVEEILESSLIIAKYMKLSMVRLAEQAPMHFDLA